MTVVDGAVVVGLLAALAVLGMMFGSGGGGVGRNEPMPEPATGSFVDLLNEAEKRGPHPKQADEAPLRFRVDRDALDA